MKCFGTTPCLTTSAHYYFVYSVSQRTIFNLLKNIHSEATILCCWFFDTFHFSLLHLTEFYLLISLLICLLNVVLTSYFICYPIQFIYCIRYISEISQCKQLKFLYTEMKYLNQFCYHHRSCSSWKPWHPHLRSI